MSDSTQLALLDETISYIRQRIQDTNTSVAVLSDLTNVPKDTINNIVYRRTKNPGFEVLATLVYALGGSIDELAGKATNAPALPEGMVDAGQSYRYISTAWMHAFALAKANATEERRAKRVWMTVALTLIVAIVVILIIDATNGSIGYIRYAMGSIERMGGKIKSLFG